MPPKLTRRELLAASSAEHRRHIIATAYRELRRDLWTVLPLASEADPPAPMFTAGPAELDQALGEPGPAGTLTAWEVLALAKRRGSVAGM